MPAPKPKQAPRAVVVATSLPPLVDLVAIRFDLLGNVAGEAFVRSCMNSEAAPRPIAGNSRGSRLLWGRDAAVEYWEGIGRNGLPADINKFAGVDA